MSSALGDHEDDFDFTEFTGHEPSQPKPAEASQMQDISLKGEVHTSYILVNSLMTILLRKGYITKEELNPLIAELHAEYMKKKGEGK